MFARTNNDKALVETSTAREFAQSIAAECGIDLCDIQSNPADPPDCIGRIGDRCIEIELAELVNADVLSAVAQARKQNRRVTSHDELFLDAQWTPDLLKDRVDRLLDKKQAAYADLAGGPVDVLLIHTDEPWLSPNDVKSWLESLSFTPRPAFKSAFLLMTYHPGYSEHWPVFRLFGDLPAS